jgi:hypothetical protein
MTNRYLMSVAAAALIAGTGFASAQGTREAPSSGAAPTQQQSAPPSERGSAATPMNRDSSQSGAPAEAPKSAQSKDMDRNGAKNQRAQEEMKGGAKGEKSAQDNNMKGERSKGMSSENDKAGASKDMKADSKSGNMDNKTGTNNAQTGTDTKSGATNAQTGGGTNSQTTGNAATSATAAPPAEKRTQIVSAIKSEKIQETTNVNFNVSVGTTIPASVRFHPLPPRIVEIYPEWRGYEVVYVRGQYLIVRPQTREIVYIIEG